MSWKHRYSRITDISQIKVGDLISWALHNNENDKRYTVVNSIRDNEIWGVYCNTKSDALKYKDKAYRGYITLKPQHIIRIEEK